MAALPSLDLPPGSLPNVAASLRRMGLWSSPNRMSHMSHYRRDRCSPSGWSPGRPAIRSSG